MRKSTRYRRLALGKIQIPRDSDPALGPGLDSLPPPSLRNAKGEIVPSEVVVWLIGSEAG